MKKTLAAKRSGRPSSTLWLAIILPFLILAACASLNPVNQGQQLLGAKEDVVKSRFGEPTNVFRLDNGNTRWLYSQQPMGPHVYAAEFNPEGALISFKDMLQTSELYKAQINVWTKKDVEQHFGEPAEPKVYFQRMKREVWSYRFMQDNFWHMLYYFYFDDNGVLRHTEAAPDPLYTSNNDGRN